MPKLNLEDTITALSTPPGEGGIAIIRLSGPAALAIADKFFKAKSGKLLAEILPQRVVYGKVKDCQGTVKDGVLATYFRTPHSYTGEDVVEISCHGGLTVSKSLIELFVSGGARLAEPGEFTRRAFLNGRLDLVQAEAVLDVIQAKTAASLLEAERQLNGDLSKIFKEIRADILNIHAEIEASLDFPEEDKEVYKNLDLQKSLETAELKISELLKTKNRGSLLRDGLSVAIVGKPNTGKSSLLNILLKRERAIVTDIPGTTRDTIEEWVEIDGFPVKFIDTAGITDTKDPVEKIGIARTHRALHEAHLVLVLFDGSAVFTSKDEVIFKSIPQGKERIICINKSDLPQKLKFPQFLTDEKHLKLIHLSAAKGTGLEELTREIVSFLEKGHAPQESVLVTNVRHADALHKTLKFLKKCSEGLTEGISLEFITEDLKTALRIMGEIVGEVYTEDLLDVIFSRFCIGK